MSNPFVVASFSIKKKRKEIAALLSANVYSYIYVSGR